MKVLFYGNCQTQAVQAALKVNNPDDSFDYAGNSRRVAMYDPERTNELMDWCDHIVTQPVMNTENPDFHEVLRSRFAGKVTFMPYIWVDGLYSLCAAPGGKEKRGDTGFLGGQIILDHLKTSGLDATLRDFERGALDFTHRRRFRSSIAELELREAFCDVRIAAFIRSNFRDQVVMLTHNHPHPTLINEIAGQIAGRLGLYHEDIGPDDPLSYAQITLPEFGKVLSPQVVADFRLRRPHDPDWLEIGREMILQIAADMVQGAESPQKAIRVRRGDERRAERAAQRATNRPPRRTPPTKSR